MLHCVAWQKPGKYDLKDFNQIIREAGRAVRQSRKHLVVATIANSRNYNFCLSLGDFLFKKKVRLEKALEVDCKLLALFS